jgi:hypothetical protein
MPAERKTKGFFSIDRGAFRCAAIRDLNSAIAYLVMARGTGPDNRTTQWSVNAIEKYTGISRPNAKKAVADLLDRGIWKKTREGNHPIYEAVPGNEIPDGPFTAVERAAITAIRHGEAVPDESNAAVEALKARGIIRERNGGRKQTLLELDETAITALVEPLSIWLPNALVDGAASEVPPIELIRQTRSLPALRLLVELYEAQFLPIFGGIPREMLRGEFERLRVGERGPFVVWGFREKTLRASNNNLARPFFTGQIATRNDGTRLDAGWDALFWPAVEILQTLGLIERVGMLLDGDDPEAEIIHPYGVNGGEPAERKLARTAHEAAVAMVTDAQLERSEWEAYPHLVPVRKHIAKATLVEIFRLRYRPHTSATAAWYAEMKDSTAEWLARYEAMIQERANRQSVKASGPCADPAMISSEGE